VQALLDGAAEVCSAGPPPSNGACDNGADRASLGARFSTVEVWGKCLIIQPLIQVLIQLSI
jgi:hypothetical protein